MENIEAIISLISAGVILLGSIITLGYKLIKAGKQIIKDKNWGKIIKIADAAMTQAEATNKSGVDKKAMVIAAVEAGCKEAGIDCDLTELNGYIDECIDFANAIKSAKELTQKK